MGNQTTILHEDLRIRQAWSRLAKKFLKIGITDVFFVDGEKGNDASAEPNSLNQAYATVQAAVTAAAAVITGIPVVLIAPGTYNEAVVIPNTFTNLVIQGWGDGGVTNIVTDTVNPALSYLAAAASTPESLQIRDLRLVTANVAAVHPLDIDCAAIDDAFLTNPLVLEGIEVIHTGGGSDLGIHLRRINQAMLSDVNVGLWAFTGWQDLLFEEVSTFYALDVQAGTWIVDYDWTAAAPVMGRGACAMTNCVLEELTVLNLAGVYGGKDMQVGTLSIDTATRDIGGNAVWGGVDYQGRVGIVDGVHVHLAGQLALATQTVSRFDNAFITADFTFVGTGSDTRFIVSCHGASFVYTDAAGIDIGTFVDFDLRRSFYDNQAMLQVDGGGDTGTIDRSYWQHTADAGGGAQTYAIPYPAGVTGADAYTVGTEVSNIADAPTSVAAKTDTGFTLTTTGANAAVICSVHRPG